MKRWGLKRFLKYEFSMLTVLLLLTPDPVFCFNLGSIVEDVGTAVKSGINAIEEGVEQILPTDEDETSPREERKSRQRQDDNSQAIDSNETVSEETGNENGSSRKSKMSAGKSSTTKSKKAGFSKASKTKGGTAAAGNMSGSVFSKNPINPKSPPSSSSSFVAGDKIYGMLKAAKPWKELNRNNNYIIVWLYIDGQKKIYKNIGLKRPELLKRDYFIIDVAPDPAEMTNYTDRDIVFPEKDGLKFGPELFTKYLSELSQGEHSFRLEVKAYNRIYASGEFTISGDDYSVYATLLADIKESSGKQQKMPKPGKTDIALQNEMRGLLKNAGWPDIRRLIIVDKDWWIDRVAGGDSAIKSRHIEATAAAKDTSGAFYFQHVTFHQPMLITGAWGKLELTHSGKKKSVQENNIDK